MANEQLTLDFFDDLPEKPDTEQIARITLKHWREHLKKVGLLESQITKLLDEAVKEAARLGKRIKPEDIGRAFSKNPSLRKNLDSVMLTLAEDITATIEQGSKDAWLRSNTAGNAVVNQMALNNAALAALLQSQQNKAQNDRALIAFQKRETAGMNLSQRVWKLVESAQRDMERAVEVALAEGTPATKLSQRIRELLQEPHRLYRRVRDKDGNLRLSQAAQQYKPGRGVYRSSYKNAMRLARTEVNMAYHAADNERWQHSWWVRGIRIWLSNNHTIKDSKGHTMPLVDICDELMGDYPADFKFTGWHPQCRCIATALTCSYADIREYYRRKRAGEDMTGYTPPGTIKEPPAAFKNWLSVNADRLAGAAERGTTPYFIRDNVKYTSAKTQAESHAANPADKQSQSKSKRPTQTQHVVLEWNGMKGLDKWIENTYNVSPEDAKEIRTTMRSFTMTNYEQIRKVQRGETEGMTKAQIRNFTHRSEIIEKVISNSPLWQGTTYRGMLLSPKELSELTNKLSKGAADMGGVASWSSDKSVAERFSHGTEANKMAMTSPAFGDKKSQRVILVAEAHSNAASIAPMSARPGENEVLASKDCRYRIVKEEIKNGVTYIYVEPSQSKPHR